MTRLRDKQQRSAEPRALALIIVMLLGGACGRGAQVEEQAPDGPQSRAEQLVAALRSGDWGAAARFVHLDTNTRTRMGIAPDAGTEEALPQIEAWFRTIYGSVRPGAVHSVAIDPSEPTRARVTYRHDDLDAFTMRLVNGKWFYVVD